MKTIVFIVMSLCLSLQILAQRPDNESLIVLYVVQPHRLEIPDEAGKLLETQMQQWVAQHGIVGDDPCNRFVLTVKADILSKDIIAGPPQSVSQQIRFTWMIGDVVENKIFETISLTVLGVGRNENKAFLSAIKKIRLDNQEMTSFLQRAKQKIVNYYAVRCEEIIQEAQRNAASKAYQEAIYRLTLVPTCCDCAQQCQILAIQYHKELRAHEAATLINEAKALWIKSPDADGAKAVADMIAQIPVDTPIQQEVDHLIKEISKKLREDEKKEWDFKMQQYKDRIQREQREFEYRSEQQKADNQAHMKRIEAYRQVGLEYARNQPKNISLTYNRIILW